MTAIPAWRPATADDVDALVALVQAAYRGPGGWTNEIGRVEGRRIDADGLSRLVGRVDGVIAVVDDAAVGGPVACCRVSAGGDGVAHLGLFAVAPAHQDRGLGRGLVTLARRLAVERLAAHVLEISVVSGQEALLAWYGRLGFRTTGETRPFGEDPRDRAILPGLHFVILRMALDDAGGGR